ncbi:MAG: hypothetical protein QOF78_4550 [Phycisphaerales bacterium]|jgi:hypothetical protein|nr:hypothetical protein [Phycisphaerales bacterium]
MPTTKAKRATAATTAAAKKKTILVWVDDPSSGQKAIRRPAPNLASGKLKLSILGTQPPAKIYKKGTAGFRYWVAAESASRGANFWGAFFPTGRTWQPGQTLPLNLDRGEDLNAYYDRVGLSFFHADAGDGTTCYSGESPDIVCHELGHAVLDALRPQLWDTPFIEAAALHESFGDISAILAALELVSERKAVLKSTRGKLYRSSRLSRVAEQLGAAIRASAPDAVDPDCLRNAVNSFFYESPETLPTNAPASMLSSESHSFSRVFTGGFFEALGNMLAVQATTPKEDDLLQVSNDAGKLMATAVMTAPVTPNYYASVAGQMLEAEGGGRYADAIQSAFVRRGILSVSSAVAVRRAAATRAPIGGRRGAAAGTAGMGIADAGVDRPMGMRRIVVPAEEYGLGDKPLIVQAPAEQPRLAAAAAAIDSGSARAPAVERAAQTFISHLFRRGRVEISSARRGGGAGIAAVNPTSRKTHKLVEESDGYRLERRYFDCGRCGG